MISRSSSAVRALHRKLPIWPSSYILGQHPHIYTGKHLCFYSAPSRRHYVKSFSKRSRVQVNEQNGDGRPKRLLHPHVLSGRLTKLADEGKLAEAVDMLQNAPKDASGVATWTTLIWHCMKAKHFQVGYKLFVDMKRRGFRPNTRTYLTLLDGLSRIEDFSTFSIQLKNAHTLYDSFLEHIEAVKKVDPKHSEISSSPIAFYIKILGTAGEYNKMFDVFYALDDGGPFSASEFHYSKMFFAIAGRQELSSGDPESLPYRNASDAKLLWRHLTKVYERRPEVLSPHVVSGCLKALSQGRPTDQIFAYDIINDYLGLSKPGGAPLPPKLPLNAPTLEAILSLCLAMQKYRLCIHYCQQVIDKPLKRGEESIVDYVHMEKVLQAYAHMAAAGSLSESSQAVAIIEWMHRQAASGWNAEKIAPRPATYTWALMTCWRGGDWTSTTRILELMSGYNSKDFLDDSRGKRPIRDGRSNNRSHMPDARGMSCVVRAAVASGDVRNMRQCLRMLLYFGESRGGLRMKQYLGERTAFKSVAIREGNSVEFYSAKMVSALKDLLDAVLEVNENGAEDEETKSWRGLQVTAKKILRTSPRMKATTPDVEAELLGSATGLAATADFVEYDMAKRMTQPRTLRK